MSRSLLVNASGTPVGLSGDPAVLVLVLIVLFGALALLGAFIIFSRRRHVREMRELVLAIEELRRGRPETDVELGSGSSLGLIADAINRLSQDLTARRREFASVSQRMRAAIDAAEDMAVITTDTDGDIRSFSRGATALYGWEEGEVLGRSAAMLFSESSFKEFLPKLTRQSARERGISTRVEQRRQDGSSFPVEVSVRTLLGPEHQAIGFLMLAKDVSAQLQLEERLRESESRYRSLIEGLTEGVAIVQRGKLVFVNPAFCKLSGRTRDALIGEPLRKLVATRDLLLMEERLADVEGGTQAANDLRVGLTDDRGEGVAELRIDATAIQVAGDPAVLLLARDDTARHRLELELRRNEARLDGVLESAADGILVLVDGPEGGRVQICNSAFAAMLDVSVPEVLGSTGKSLADLLRGRSGASALRDVLGTRGAAARGPRSITTTKGRKIDASSTPLYDRDGQPLGRVVTCRDVTRRRQAEEQLQEFAERLQLSKVELESAYSRLEEMHESVEGRALELDRLNEELRKLNEMKSRLLGNVSHELQTPLVSIRGYTEMILKGRLGPVTDEQRRGLSLALKNIDRLIGMIDNLLSFARGAPDVGNLELSRFPFGPLTREAVELLRPKLEEKGLQLDGTVEDGLEVHADREKVLQVLLNLLSNAIKFNHQGGRVTLSARRRSDDLIQVQVSDTGVGIAREQLDKVFDRHFRADSGEARPPGSGLGLAIVRDILRVHGCTIQVESEVGRGSTFSFTLPAGLSMEAPEPPVENESPPDAGPERAGPQGSSDEREAAANQISPSDSTQDGPADPSGEASADHRRPRFRVIRRYDPRR